MLDATRRMLAIGLLALAVVGLLPLLPKVGAFYSAAVKNDTAGTYYPAAGTAVAQFVTCQQTPNNITVNKDKMYSGNFVRCTNDWGTPVSATVSVANPNGTGLSFTPSATGSIAAGGTGCVTMTDFIATTNTGGFTPVIYEAVVNQSDLYIKIQFAGNVRVRGGNTTLAPQC